jgi:6-phosphogluconolactonase
MARKAKSGISAETLAAIADQEIKKRNGITIIHRDEKRGSQLAASILYEITDRDTVLFLSGGRTPASLYAQLAEEQRLTAGGVAMVDERFGRPLHEGSNELMLVKSGLTAYLEKVNIPFYQIISGRGEIAGDTMRYERIVQGLLDRYSRSAAILGIGEDGHTAGIAPNRVDFTNPLFASDENKRLVSFFKDEGTLTSPGNRFGERITMTIKGISQLDFLIVLVFGENKQAALERIFMDGSIEEVSARFLKRRDVAGKTIFITDRDV